MTSVLTGIGLTLNIGGALLIWKFGLPQPITRTGANHLVVSQSDQHEIKRAKKFDRLSLLGVALFALGFLVQLLTTLI